MTRISVFLTDWQILFREGIHFTLSGEDDIDVIGEATNSEDALKAIEANPPDVAVLNANHDQLGGIRAARRLTQDFPSMAVLLIMDTDDEEQLFEAMKSGAGACLTKDADPAELIDMIRAMAQGGQPISDSLLRPEIADRVLAEFEQAALMSQQLDNLLARLTPGEAEILHHIADGTAIDDVCQKLNISEETINRHFGLVITKLVKNDYVRQIIEAAQKSMLSAAFQAQMSGQPTADFITREEFTTFKESIREQLGSGTGREVERGETKRREKRPAASPESKQQEGANQPS